MYLILDLHAAPGGQGNDINISDRDAANPLCGKVKPINKRQLHFGKN